MNRLVTEVFRTLVSMAIIACGIVGMLAFGSRPGPPKKEKTEQVAVLVDTVEIAAHVGDMDIEVDGVAVPFREVVIAAEVAGRISFKAENCRAGQYIKETAPLIKIDPEMYDLALTRLAKNQEEAQQNLDELAVEISNSNELISLAKADIKLRTNELNRQKRLGTSGVGTAADRENSERALLQSRNSLQSLVNQQRLLKKRVSRLETSKDLVGIQLKQAQLDKDHATINSPISGVVVTEHVEKNSYVQRGASLVTIEDTQKVEVRCSLTMEELYRLWEQEDGSETKRGEYDVPPTRVTVVYELAGHEYQWDGKLDRFDGIGLDEKTRTVPCRVVVDQPRTVFERQNEDSRIQARGGPPALVRGMFVRVRLHTKPRSAVLRVPERAVRPGNRIWLVRDGQLTIQKAIVAGFKERDLLIDAEASGISEGEFAIVSPLSNPAEGLEVRTSADEPNAPEKADK